MSQLIGSATILLYIKLEFRINGGRHHKFHLVYLIPNSFVVFSVGTIARDEWFVVHGAGRCLANADLISLTSTGASANIVCHIDSKIYTKLDPKYTVSEWSMDTLGRAQLFL